MKLPILDKPAIDPRLVASLAAVYLVWSSTYLAMWITVEDLPPLLSAALRFLAAGIVMLAIANIISQNMLHIMWHIRKQHIVDLLIGSTTQVGLLVLAL